MPKTHFTRLLLLMAALLIPSAYSKAQAPKTALMWKDRVASWTIEEEPVDLQPGRFALGVEDGRAFFVPLERLQKPPAEDNPIFGLEETIRPPSATQRQLLQKGMTFEGTGFGFISSGEGDCALIVKTDDSTIPARFIRISGNRLLYLTSSDRLPSGLAVRPSDSASQNRARRNRTGGGGQGLKLVRRSDPAPQEVETREISLDSIKSIQAPPTWIETIRDTCRQEGFIYDTETKSLKHILLAKLEANPPSGRPGRMAISVDGSHGTDFELWKISPDGRITYRADSRYNVHPRINMNNSLYSRCGGAITSLVLDDESGYRHDPSMKAFIHDPDTPLPLTAKSLRNLPEVRLSFYRDLTKYIISQGSKMPTWRDLTPDERVDFNNLFHQVQNLSWIQTGNDLAHRRGLDDWNSLKVEAQWDVLSSLRIEEQLELLISAGDRPKFYCDIVEKYARLQDGQPVTWESLSSYEQLAIHKHFELVFRRIQERRERQERVWTAVISGIAGWDALVQASIEKSERVRQEAMSRTYDVGDPVRSFESLGGWTGTVWEDWGNNKYTIRINRSSDPKYQPGEDYSLFKGEFRHQD